MAKNRYEQVMPAGKFDWFKEIEIKKLSDNAFLPKRSDKQAIGFDLYVPNDTVIPAHSRVIVPLDIAIGLPSCVEAKIEPRSGYSAKGMEGYGVKQSPCKVFGVIPWHKTQVGMFRFDADVLVGKIDPGYKDGVGVIIRNNDEEFVLKRGTRVAQMTFYRVSIPRGFTLCETLSGADRGGGFGHSNEEQKQKR